MAHRRQLQVDRIEALQQDLEVMNQSETINLRDTTFSSTDSNELNSTASQLSQSTGSSPSSKHRSQEADSMVIATGQMAITQTSPLWSIASGCPLRFPLSSIMTVADLRPILPPQAVQVDCTGSHQIALIAIPILLHQY